MRALFCLMLMGCDPSVMIGDPIDGGSTDAGTMSGADAGPQIGSGCPRVRLGRSTDVTFTADTSALPNLVQSARLEWTDAPDDALEFIADQTGDYLVEFTSSNASLAASFEQYTGTSSSRVPFTASSCPPSGLVVSIDGVYGANQPMYPLPLTAGQRVLIFVSAPSWAAVKTGTYSVRVRQVP